MTTTIKVKDWNRLIDELVSGHDLTKAEDRDAAYEKCIRYADKHMNGDLLCNVFLAHAASRLGTVRAMRDVVREIVPLSDNACVHVAYEPGEGPMITANREGLKYLAQIFELLSKAHLMGEQVRLLWDQPPFIGETYGMSVFLEDDEWFDDFAQDYYSAQDEPVLVPRQITAEQVIALQFPICLSTSLYLTPGKLYLVRDLKKKSGDDDVWIKQLREDDSRTWVFTIQDDYGEDLRLSIDLDDPDIYYLTRIDLDQLLQ